jgi:hypothetical protein
MWKMQAHFSTKENNQRKSAPDAAILRILFSTGGDRRGFLPLDPISDHCDLSLIAPPLRVLIPPKENCDARRGITGFIRW